MAQHAVAQNVTRSPYSSFGLGEMQFTGSAWMKAMGQIGQGYNANFFINNQNPASYSALQYTIFDVGAVGSIGTLSTQNESNKINTASYGYFAMAFPLYQKINLGASLGFMPYSSVGYNLTKTVTTPTFTGEEKLTGTGGLSQAYFGSGIKLTKKISVGANAKFLFGSMETSMFLNIPAELLMYNLTEDRQRFITGFVYDLGIQYGDTFTRNQNKYKWGFGVTVTPPSNLNLSDDYNIRTLPVGSTSPISGGGFGKDTIVNVEGARGKVAHPAMLKAGFHFQEINAWSFGFDVGYYNWEKLQIAGTNQGLHDAITFGVGGSIIPNAAALKGYFNKVEYRGGVRYEKGNIKINNNDINTYAISAGVGLPLGMARTRLNVTGEYIVKGTKNNNLLREEYFRFTVGVIISDKWFYRYRYD